MDALSCLLDLQGDLSCLVLKARRANSRDPEGLTHVLAIRCETFTTTKSNNRVARCSVVNMYGYVVLDMFVDPECRVADHRTRWSGINRKVLRNAKDRGDFWDLERLQDELLNMFDGRVIVGHNVRKDLDILKFGHDISIRAIDTQNYSYIGKRIWLKPYSRTTLK